MRPDQEVSDVERLANAVYGSVRRTAVRKAGSPTADTTMIGTREPYIVIQRCHEILILRAGASPMSTIARHGIASRAFFVIAYVVLQKD
ncbi:MAG: hypothetical protein ACR2IK_03870 [Chloroflexota bacterium]